MSDEADHRGEVNADQRDAYQRNAEARDFAIAIMTAKIGGDYALAMRMIQDVVGGDGPVNAGTLLWQTICLAAALASGNAKLLADGVEALSDRPYHPAMLPGYWQAFAEHWAIR